MQTKHYIAIALAAGLVIGIGAWLIFMPKQAVAPSSSTASTTVTDLGGGNKVVTTGSSTITEIDTQLTTQKPPAIAALTFSADTSADLKTALQSQYNTLTAELKTAPTRVDLWLQLGVIYKIAGEYQAAITVWTYVGQAAPASVSAVAYGNLGDLYLNFTHNYAKSESSYKSALAMSPGNADYTAGLKAAQQAQGK